MAEFITEQQITHTLLLPSLYNLLLTQPSKKLSSLNTVILAGETCTADVSLQHIAKLPNTSLFNEYGPTEGTVWSTVFQINSEQLTNSVPIGRPIDNTKALILDDNHQLVPVGIVGELYIGGPGLSSGYLNRNELTQEKFITDCYSEEESQFIYKTGDLARYRPDGNIEFLGRADNQVKVRGYRIEPGEIQSVINTYPGVQESAIVFAQNHSAETLETDQIVALMQEMNPEHAEYLINEIENIAIQRHRDNQ